VFTVININGETSLYCYRYLTNKGRTGCNFERARFFRERIRGSSSASNSSDSGPLVLNFRNREANQSSIITGIPSYCCRNLYRYRVCVPVPFFSWIGRRSCQNIYSRKYRYRNHGFTHVTLHLQYIKIVYVWSVADLDSDP
jgi:hypothetical protein